MGKPHPLKDLPKVPAVDNTSDLKDVFRKVNKLSSLWEDGKVDYSKIFTRFGDCI